MFPIGLIDHIDVLLDGASAIYGADAVAGVFNVSLIHRFQNHAETYFSYGNTNLGASNDQAEELAYVLGGVGDDKTDIVLYAEWYKRDAIYSRDRDISSNADFTRLGGPAMMTVGRLCRALARVVDEGAADRASRFFSCTNGDGTVIARVERLRRTYLAPIPCYLHRSDDWLRLQGARSAVAFNNTNVPQDSLAGGSAKTAL